MKTWAKVGLGALAVGAVAVVVSKRAAAKDTSPLPSSTSSTKPTPPGAPGPSASAPGPAAPTKSGNGYSLEEKKNVTDDIAPAPPDVNDPAPPGSHIVGWKTPDGASPEMNRILNLRERWNRIAKWGQMDPKTGFFKRLQPDEVVKYQAWTLFGNTSDGRLLRSMQGWEEQFQSLESVEDTIKKRDGSFVVDRRDVTLLPHKPGT